MVLDAYPVNGVRPTSRWPLPASGSPAPIPGCQRWRSEGGSATADAPRPPLVCWAAPGLLPLTDGRV